jgi:hypothetical protein
MGDFMKTIMIIALLLVAISASGEWLDVDFGFQAGWIPKGAVYFYQPDNRIQLDPSFDATFEINTHVFKYFIIGGKCITLFSFSPTDQNPAAFMPTGMNYLFNFGIEPFENIKIMYEHSCFHPVMPYFPKNHGYPQLDGSFDRIYFEIKMSFDF